MNEEIKKSILIVDDDSGSRNTLTMILRHKGYQVDAAGTGREALEKVRAQFYHVGIVDLRLPDVMGTALLEPMKTAQPDMMIIMATAHASIETAVEAVNEGASAYITKPLDVDVLFLQIENVLEKQRLIVENRQLYQAAQRDLAQRLVVEKVLTQRAGQLSVLNQIGRQISSELELESVLNTTAQLVHNRFAYNHVALFLLDDEEEYLNMKTSAGSFGVTPPVDHRIKMRQGMIGWVAHSGETLLANDVSQEPHFINTYSKLISTQSELSVPIRSGLKVVGVIDVQSPEMNAFTENDILVIETLADQIAAAVRNSQLYSQVQTQLSELEQLYATLQEERGTLAQRVAERTEELSSANAELAKAARLKDEFMANMSHELRTPLSAILGLSEALQEEVYGPLTPKQASSLHSIWEAGRHLLELINEVLDIAKIGAGKLAIEVMPTAMEPLCRACLRLIDQPARDKQLTVNFNYDNKVTTIPVDMRRFRQILVNLMGNAGKFTPEGGVIGLDVIGDDAQNVVHFVVWDTGIGIAETEMENLFQPFVQLDKGLSRRYQGTGLGLTLVHRLTELHGGGVTVESQEGQGSRFTVTLPWKLPTKFSNFPAQTGHKGETQLITPDDGQRSNEKPLLLIAEDNDTIIQTYSEYLQAIGYRVIVAHNGIEAVEKTQETRPHLVLMDIQMPQMDGLEAISRIRADQEVAHIPIIALTALAMPGDRQRCFDAGANGYLSKPVSLVDLTTTIRSLLAQ
ncbi:MAG: response regulator [Anaerolineales bacterium]|nr:MAG: response regulator [Anaerolineales bacterium]